MRYGKYKYLLDALPSRCNLGVYGYCPTHAVSWNGHGAWCSVAAPHALTVARTYERLAEEPPSGWWLQTGYRRKQWHKCQQQQLAAAAHIRRMLQGAQW